VNGNRFDTAARRVGVSRRRSLGAFGGVAVALVSPTAAAAGGGNARKAVRKRCASQRGQCLTGVQRACAPTIDPAVCEASLTPCCDHFARCDAETGVTCLFKPE
jgi:hypothetical protein